MARWAMACTCSALKAGRSSRRNCPCTLSTGAVPLDRCRSEAFCAIARLSKSVSFMVFPGGFRGYSLPMASISTQLEQVRKRVDKACTDTGREPHSVTLLAVSKTFGPQAVIEAVQAGQRDFGEN